MWGIYLCLNLTYNNNQDKLPYCFGKCIFERRLDSQVEWISHSLVSCQRTVFLSEQHCCRISLEEQSAFTELLKQLLATSCLVQQIQQIFFRADRKLGIQCEQTSTPHPLVNRNICILIIYLLVFAEASARQSLLSLIFVLSDPRHERLLGKELAMNYLTSS